MLEIIQLHEARRLCGVYAIVKTKGTQRRYIGSTVDVGRRLAEHRRSLRRRAHHNRHLQRAWNKYGEAAFKFYLLVELPAADKEALLAAEQKFLDDAGDLYNSNPRAESCLGRRMSEETRAKMRRAKQNMSPETRKRMSESGRIKFFSAEHRAKISAANKNNTANLGRKLPEAWRAALSRSARLRVCTPECKKKMSVSAQRRKRDSRGHFLPAASDG